MASKIENYGFIGDLRGSALVSRDGSVDWLCVPRFDSPACMAALLGRDEHGCWLIYPGAQVRSIQRRYKPGTLILETDYACDGGVMRTIDFMPIESNCPSLIRVVEGVEGSVSFLCSLSVRFGYGGYTPWITKLDGGIRMTTAPDSMVLRTPAPVVFDERDVRGSITVRKGERIPFELTWCPSRLRDPPAPLDVEEELAATERWWKEWSGRSTYRGPYQEAVNQSLVVLKGMTYAPSGGIVAAPTAGLPEEIGGVRNWDYRYCWLRDAALTLDSLMMGGYAEEAVAWRDWLLAAVAGGTPSELQIMYGVEGERRLTEFEVPWLPGYEESRPVRIGNAASEQFQLDVYGELVQVAYEVRRLGLEESPHIRARTQKILEFMSSVWQRPDDGVWEMRGGRRHFVHSKLMAWVAVDRMARVIDEFEPEDGPSRASLPSLRALRDRIHRDICEHGFDPQLNSFTQAYNSKALDAGVLLIPAYGFLPASDPRVQGTIAAVEKDLVKDGFVLRYQTQLANDGLSGSEGAFLACSFWLVDAYAYSGRRREAELLFDQLLNLRNDLGLLSEEYDPKSGRLVGNFPQAFSHLALIHSASVLGGCEVTPRTRTDRGAKLQPVAAPPPGE